MSKIKTLLASSLILAASGVSAEVTEKVNSKNEKMPYSDYIPYSISSRKKTPLNPHGIDVKDVSKFGSNLTPKEYGIMLQNAGKQIWNKKK